MEEPKNVNMEHKPDNFNYKKYEKLDVSELKSMILNENPEIWNFSGKLIFRNLDTHGKADTIPLYWTRKKDEPYVICKFVMYEKYFKYINPILDYIKTIYKNHFPIKVALVKLVPGAYITPHIDRSDLLEVPNRLHIPIITNDNVMFHVNDEVINMKEGYLYEINNIRMHHVVNEGDTDRVHLLIDMFPRDYKIDRGFVESEISELSDLPASWTPRII